MTDILAAPAKINLTLFITATRADGYHELESLFVPVPGLTDTLEISQADDGAGCLLESPLADCEPEENLVYKAWRAYAQATGYAPNIRVRLTKRIPTGAGLGGGSSDAATMLRWLQANAGGVALGPEVLNALAARIGADVPFFLLHGPALAQGIGDRLTPVALDLSPFTLVLALPLIKVSTPWAYAAWDQQTESKNPVRHDTDCLTTLESANKRRVSLSPVLAWNDFESVVFPANYDLRLIKELLLRLGAASAVMSGSGAGIVSLFRDVRQAEEAAQALRLRDVPVHVETLRQWGVAKR